METAKNNVVRILMAGVALAMALYHLVYTQWMILGPIQHQNLHYMMALVLVFLWAFTKQKTTLGKAAVVLLIGLSIYATAYMFLNYSGLQEERGPMLDLTGQDMLVGVLLVGLGIEASRRSFGWVFPIVALCFIAYAVFGHNLPGPLQSPRIGIDELLVSYGLDLSGGIYGQVLGISANYIFLFVLFGSLLGATGAARFFNQVGMLTGSKLDGGPAITAVVSSALMGSVTGSVMANVAATGAFTIPLMKKVGYKPYQAGAIEAAASSGGQIMPPVMGATAFVMAELAEVPYVTVMAAALIPSLLYFLSVGMYAQLQAKRLGIRMDPSDIAAFSFRAFLHDAPIFVLPLLAIIALLVMGYSPMFTIFWAMMLLLVLNVIDIATSKRYDQLKNILPAFIDGAVTGAKIGVTCAVLGPIMTTVTKTLLGIKIPQLIVLWSQGSIPLALFITMCVCLILGMGVPTLAAYLLVSMVGIPVLVNMGVDPFAAHMFVFVFACFSCLTPPIAIAALPAAGIAGSSYMRTALEASMVGAVGFAIPYLVVGRPALMLGQGPFGETLAVSIVGVFTVIAFCMMITGYGMRPLRLPERWGLAFVVALCGLWIGAGQLPFLLTGLAVFAALLALQFRGRRKAA
ncbi:TRAP transporter fused permease subunit [uncultured Mailhella sp.]|uniref:TRAP transporter permease n=1 Tax=uncultured Mailhella sp. TaxID=1981031 RepID=UPI002612C712|nr:TRAP transporter fused permease subunit [uncultured Mailhella sp.]